MIRLNADEEQSLYLNLPDSTSYMFIFEHTLSKKQTEIELYADEFDSLRFKKFTLDTTGLAEGDYLLCIELTDETLYYFKVQIFGESGNSRNYERGTNERRFYER